MKRSIHVLSRLLPALWAVHLLGSCAATGDPNEDSIFFSPRLADERHDRMRNDLSGIEEDTREARNSATHKRKVLGDVQTGNRSREREIAELETKRDRLIQEKEVLDGKIDDAEKEGRDDATLIKRRSDLESEIDKTKKQLRILIKIQ